jgi:23S rRNA (guanosine2251-2'-O)-methyltransferase
MERSKRGKHSKKKKLLGNHQRCWLWGRHTITEILEGGRWPVAELHLSEDLPEEELARMRDFGQRADIKLIEAHPGRLTELCHSSEHQGYLAKMRPYVYTEAEELLSMIAQKACPLVVILDSIQDPHNFGALLRSAEVFGVDAVFAADSHQAQVSGLVARSSAGAIHRMPICRTHDLAALIQQLQTAGIHVTAATEKADEDCRSNDFVQPTALVLGNEGRGISPELLAVCNGQTRIPQCGAIASLNVAAAAAILFYEVYRQRQENAAT